MPNWQQTRSDFDYETIAICVCIWLWICRQRLLTGYASRLMAETRQNLVESDSQSALHLPTDYARLCLVSATNLLA